jgi:hypothetical protein
MSKKKNRFPDNPNPAADPIMGLPQDSYDMVNKYGTYNVQDTADTPNDFPAIAQGRPKGKKVEPRR